MVDNLSRKGKGDDKRINLHQTHEINYWTKQLNCSADQLKQAVAAVGPMVPDVKKWLSSNK